MKVIGIYLSAIDHATGPIFKKPPYTNAYPQLFRLLLGTDVRPVLVHNQAETYQGKGCFSEYYDIYIRHGVVAYERVAEPIAVDFIYDKARFDADDVAVLNLPKVRDISRDKMQTYGLFPELHPHSVLVKDQTDLRSCLQLQPEKIIAIKGLDSNEGREVYVGRAYDYDDAIGFPVIVQDFVETSAGFPGLVDGRHDVRVCIYNGEVIGGRLRTPPRDGLLSNIRFGGANRTLLLAEIPQELLDITQHVDRVLSRFTEHRFIAADFGYDGNKWVMFELNPWPGLVDMNDGVAEEYFMRKLVEQLARCTNER
jgi:glutathione synthase/RimK-type ligase-like ATP-grasp enzyme